MVPLPKENFCFGFNCVGTVVFADLEESELRVESHDGVIVQILGQRLLIDLDGPLEGKRYNKLKFGDL